MSRFNSFSVRSIFWRERLNYTQNLRPSAKTLLNSKVYLKVPIEQPYWWKVALW